MAGRKKFPWYDETIPHEERISLLVKALTLPEKVSMMMNESPEIRRLGIGAFHWWNEACHGVARAGRATVFPQSIGLGATFDEPLIRDIGEAISTEGRVKHAAAAKNRTRNQYLTSRTGRRTSTSSAIRAGAGGRRLSASVPF